MNCINCGAEVVGKFCQNCGQPSPPRKITLAGMYYDFQEKVYGFDGMFPRTLKALTIRPGKASRSFIEGNRVQYYSPVGYFFLMITVLLLLVSLLDVELTEFLKESGKSNWAPQPKAGSGGEKFAMLVRQFVSDNMKLISFIQIPLQAFVVRYIFFRRSKLGFLEHTVLPFYIQGHLYWVGIIGVIYFKLTGSFIVNWLTTAIGPIYFSYAFADFFDHQSKVKVFVKGLGVYLFSLILFVVIVTITVGIVVWLYPDLLDMLRPSNNG